MPELCDRYAGIYSSNLAVPVPIGVIIV